MTAVPVPTPYEDRLVVKPEWLDPNGHMNVAFYLRAVDDGTNAFFDDIGLGWGYTEAGTGSIFVTGCNLDFRRELFAGSRIRVTTQLVDWNPKLVHCYSEVFDEGEDVLAATCESMYMHISFANRRGADMPQTAQARLAEIHAAHASGLGRPVALNRPLGIRR
ncbi:MAG: thioesterase family protein [Gammaproteobacteria bacterium]